MFQQQPGYSPYHYSANDPVNDSDGSGLFTETERSQSSITDDDQLPDQISSGSWLTWGGSGAKGTYFAGGFGVETHPLPGGMYHRVRMWVETSPLEPGHWGGWGESNNIFAAENGTTFNLGNRLGHFGNFYRGGSGGGGTQTTGNAQIEIKVSEPVYGANTMRDMTINEYSKLEGLANQTRIGAALLNNTPVWTIKSRRMNGL